MSPRDGRCVGYSLYRQRNSLWSFTLVQDYPDCGRALSPMEEIREPQRCIKTTATATTMGCLSLEPSLLLLPQNPTVCVPTSPEPGLAGLCHQ